MPAKRSAEADASDHGNIVAANPTADGWSYLEASDILSENDNGRRTKWPPFETRISGTGRTTAALNPYGNAIMPGCWK